MTGSGSGGAGGTKFFESAVIRPMACGRYAESLVLATWVDLVKLYTRQACSLEDSPLRRGPERWLSADRGVPNGRFHLLTRAIRSLKGSCRAGRRLR